MVIIFETISSLLVPETITKFSQVLCVERFKTILFYDFFNAAKTILGESSLILPPSFFTFVQHMGILSEHARRESNYSSSAPLLF